MDFEKTEAVAKKPVQSDFEHGVITLPLIYAFRVMTGLKDKARETGLSRDEINEAVVKTGGLGYTRMISKKYYDKSLKIIDELNITADKKAKLLAVLDKAKGLS